MLRFKLYSAPLRSRLYLRSPYLEAVDEDVESLRRLPVWRFQPSVITDMDDNVIDDNGLEIAAPCSR